jgi:hypothetical protein
MVHGQGLSEHLWSEPFLRSRLGNLTLHKLRSFKRDGAEAATEASWRSMTMDRYLDYLAER